MAARGAGRGFGAGLGSSFGSGFGNALVVPCEFERAHCSPLGLSQNCDTVVPLDLQVCKMRRLFAGVKGSKLKLFLGIDRVRKQNGSIGADVVNRRSPDRVGLKALPRDMSMHDRLTQVRKDMDLISSVEQAL